MYQWRVLIPRSLYKLCFAGFAVVSLYLMLSIPPEIVGDWQINDKVAHFITFFFLTLFLSRGLPRSYGWQSILALAAFGLLVEVIQYFLPWRSFSIADWLADIAGILCYHCLHLIRCHFVKIYRS